MIILRIETSNGRGCYTAGVADFAHEKTDCPLVETRHPNPENDMGLSEAWDHIQSGHHPHISSLNNRFGFISPEQYFAWFSTDEIRAYLDRRKMRVVFYDVADVHVVYSKHQAIFDLRASVRLNDVPCTSTLEHLHHAWTTAQRNTGTPALAA